MDVSVSPLMIVWGTEADASGAASASAAPAPRGVPTAARFLERTVLLSGVELRASQFASALLASLRPYVSLTSCCRGRARLPGDQLSHSATAVSNGPAIAGSPMAFQAWELAGI